MTEQPKYAHMGLGEFIDRRKLNVEETALDKYTKLTLTPTEQTTRDRVVGGFSWGNFTSDVLLLDNYVVGAKSKPWRDHSNFLVSTALEQIGGYELILKGEDVYTNIAVRQKSQGVSDFESFLSLGYTWSYSTETSDVHLAYGGNENRGKPHIIRFQTYGDTQVYFFPDRTWKILRDEDSVQVSREDNGLYTVTRDVKGIGKISAEFPEIITPEEIQKIIESLETETGWLEMPKRIPTEELPQTETEGSTFPDIGILQCSVETSLEDHIREAEKRRNQHKDEE